MSSFSRVLKYCTCDNSIFSRSIKQVIKKNKKNSCLDGKHEAADFHIEMANGGKSRGRPSYTQPCKATDELIKEDLVV